MFAAFDLLSPWPSWLVLLWLAGTIAAVAALYRREAGIRSANARRFLVALRIATLAAFLGILFEPVVISEEIRDRSQSVAVLVDESASMALSDLGGRTRLSEAGRLCIEKGWLATLEKRYRVRLYGFSDGLRAVDRSPERPDGPVFPQQAAGVATSIGGALRSAMTELRDQSLAAILLLTDGQDNVGEDPRTAAAALGRREIPVHAIGIGDPEGARDLEVRSLIVSDAILLEDTVPFTARLEGRRLEGQLVHLALIEDGREVASRTLSLTGRPQEATLFHKPVRPGRFTYQIRAETLPGELTPENNSTSKTVEVLDEKIKILMVDGYPRWEFQYLRNALKRDPVTRVSVLQEDADPEFFPEGSLPIRAYPSLRQDLEQYDLVLFGDVSPAYLTHDQLEATVQFVQERHGGILFLAGSRNGTPQAWRGTPLEKLLPVLLFDPEEEPSASGRRELYDVEHPWIPTAEGKASRALQLGIDPETTDLLWRRLPGFFWSAPVKKLKPLASVLLQSRDPEGGPSPVLISHYAGTGRTALLLTDETWRWRAGVEDLYFYRFWGGLIRHLSHNRFYGKDRRFRLETGGRRRFELGQAIPLAATVLNERHEPVRWESAEAVASRQEAPAVPIGLESDPAAPGTFRGMFTPQEAGTYELALWIDRKKEAPVTVEVIPPQKELRATVMGEPLLAQIARESGGSYTRSTDASIDTIMAQVPQKTTRLQTRSVWDHPFVFGLLVLLLAAEWAVRRMNRAL